MKTRALAYISDRDPLSGRPKVKTVQKRPKVLLPHVDGRPDAHLGHAGPRSRQMVARAAVVVVALGRAQSLCLFILFCIMIRN